MRSRSIKSTLSQWEWSTDSRIQAWLPMLGRDLRRRLWRLSSRRLQWRSTPQKVWSIGRKSRSSSVARCEQEASAQTQLRKVTRLELKLRRQEALWIRHWFCFRTEQTPNRFEATELQPDVFECFILRTHLFQGGSFRLQTFRWS